MAKKLTCYCCKINLEYDTSNDKLTCRCGAVYLIGGVGGIYLVKPSQYNDKVTPNFVKGEQLDYRDSPGSELPLLALYTNVEELQSHYD